MTIVDRTAPPFGGAADRGRAPVVVHANLDAEATWAGVALPARVLERISAAGTLMGAFGDEVWTPVGVDPARIGLAVTLRVGTPPRADVAWAQPSAKAANDRRLAVTLTGARVVTTLAELEVPGSWIAKAPWSAAGRDRVRGPLDAETRVYATRLLAKHGALCIEPWRERRFDFGVCAMVAEGRVVAHPPHSLLVDPRGGFVGIDLAEPPLATAQRDRVLAAVHAAGALIAGVGYSGPFAIDGFVHGDGEVQICEINARHTFGWVTRALGVRRLGFGPPPSSDARVLIRPGDCEPSCAWVSMT